MTESEIKTKIRIGLREYETRIVVDAVLSDTILCGVTAIGFEITRVAPAFFSKRVSCSSSTFVFPWPTDCMSIQKIWDMGTTAGNITNATNAGPIVITEAAHTRATNNIVIIHNVVGNTAANGVWKITKVDADSYSLNGSIGNAAYVSGGKVFQELSYSDELKKINLAEANLGHTNKWYPRGKEIVVDDLTFANDIIVDYLSSPNVITDIPVEYHDGLVSFGIIEHIVIPKPTASGYEDKKNIFARHFARWEIIKNQIAINLKSSSEPTYIRRVMD